MKMDDKLTRELLKKLAELEKSLQQDDIILIQPAIEGMRIERPLSVPGYDHEQIDSHLRELVARRLVDNGGIQHPLIGIHFRSLTVAGRRLLAQQTAG